MSSIFADVHAAGKNDLNFILRLRAQNSARLFCGLNRSPDLAERARACYFCPGRGGMMMFLDDFFAKSTKNTVQTSRMLVFYMVKNPIGGICEQEEFP